MGSVKFSAIVSGMNRMLGRLSSRGVALIAEHPWTIGITLVVLAFIFWQVGARRGSTGMIGASVGTLLAALLVAIVAWLTQTPADASQATALQLVAAAEAGDPAAAKALFTSTATIHMGTPESAGEGRDKIDRAFNSFAGRHRIEDNSIWSIDATTISPTRGSVDLTCRTRTATSLGTIPTQWTIEVERQPDGSWKIFRITWRAVASQKPSLSLL